MKQHIDWETMMETTLHGAQAASRNSENAVAGMAKLLRDFNHLSSKTQTVKVSQKEIQTSLTELQDVQKTLVAALDRPQPRPVLRPSLVAIIGTLAVVFAVGATFGGYIVS